VRAAVRAAPASARSRGRGGARGRPTRRTSAPAWTRQPRHHQRLSPRHRQLRDHQHRPRAAVADGLCQRWPQDQELDERRLGRPAGAGRPDATPPRCEWDVRGDARAQTRFHFRMGITSVVPWLVVSDSTRGSLVSSVLAGWPRWLPSGGAAEARFTRGRALSSSPSVCPRRATRLASGGCGSVRRVWARGGERRRPVGGVRAWLRSCARPFAIGLVGGQWRSEEGHVMVLEHGCDRRSVVCGGAR
jgi:hypothetical protein